MKNRIDHLVYSVPDLDAACAHFAELLGVRPVFGGRHLTQGTKNALLDLSNKRYLELLAIDDTNLDIVPPRWMGIDLLRAPKITRWAVKSNALLDKSYILEKYHPRLGEIKKGQRKLDNGEILEWQLTMPFSEIEVEVVPFFIDWGNSGSHPTDNLPHECELLELKIHHPQPLEIGAVFKGLGIDVKIIESTVPKISAVLNSPKGKVEI